MICEKLSSFLVSASPSVKTKDLSACTVALKDDAELVPLGIPLRIRAGVSPMSNFCPVKRDRDKKLVL